MTISALQTMLEHVLRQHGDIEVKCGRATIAGIAIYDEREKRIANILTRATASPARDTLGAP